MNIRIEDKFNKIIDHYILACLFLSLIMLTWAGVGDAAGVSILGLILCMLGMMQPSAQADVRILGALIVYSLLGMVSACAAFGFPAGGYASTHMIFPALYLLMAGLNKGEQILLRRWCAFWGGSVAAIGVFAYVFHAAAEGRGGRLGEVLGNPNALGIFLVIGWFALMGCMQEADGSQRKFLFYTEPVLLAALGLTLSMGSFVAMAAGIFVLLAEKKKRCSFKELWWYACSLLARASLGVGTGVLFYLAASRTGLAWSCLLVLIDMLIMVPCWKDFLLFCEQCKRETALIAVSGFLVAVVAVLIRPSAVDTFAERLEMMKSAINYLVSNPFFGVGPYRWRLLDLADGGIYFNTWHIHNTFLHVGVELGWAAMAALAAVVVWFYQESPMSLAGRRKNGTTKRHVGYCGFRNMAKAGFAAFLVHNLIDTSFFYVGVTAFVLMTVANPDKNRWIIKGIVLKLLFGFFILVFVLDLYSYFIVYS